MNADQLLQTRKHTLCFEGLTAWIGAAILLLAAVLWTDHSFLVEKTDFSVTYTGARIAHEGRADHLYDLAEQQRSKSTVLKNAEPLIYEHPPFEALILEPLGALPYRSAYLIWGVLNVIVWLTLPILLRPYAPVPKSELAYLCLWLLFPPLGITLYQGQSSLLLALVYTFTYVSLRHGNEFRAGLWLGLGLFKFQFVIPFALIFLVRRRWRMMAAFTTTAAALTLLSLVTVGWQGLVSYFHLLSEIGRHPNNISYGAARDMATVQGFIHTVLGNTMAPTMIPYVAAAGSLGMIVLVALLWPTGSGSPWDEYSNVMFGASVVVSLVAGSHMFAHDLSPLILALFLVLPLLYKSTAPVRMVLWSSLLLFWTPVYFPLIKWHGMYLFSVVLVTFAAAAVLTARTAALDLRERAQPATA